MGAVPETDTWLPTRTAREWPQMPSYGFPEKTTRRSIDVVSRAGGGAPANRRLGGDDEGRLRPARRRASARARAAPALIPLGIRDEARDRPRRADCGRGGSGRPGRAGRA